MIQEITLKDVHFKPGEVLSHKSNEYTHITITYNISGDRYAVDSNVDTAIEDDSNLEKVNCVNTTMYWQINLGESEQSKESLVLEAKKILKEKLKEIFVGDSGLNGATVTAFCMVGNLRAFAFKLY